MMRCSFFYRKTDIIPFYSVRTKFFNKKKTRRRNSFIMSLTKFYLCHAYWIWRRQDKNSLLSLALNKYSFSAFFFLSRIVWPTNNNNLKHLPAIRDATYITWCIPIYQNITSATFVCIWIRMANFLSQQAVWMFVKWNVCKQDIIKQKKLIYHRSAIIKSINRCTLWSSAERKKEIKFFDMVSENWCAVEH